MASILHRFYPQVSLLRWFMVLILGLITHMLLDFLTVYGTGLLEPFSNLRFELPTISIVDPIYSLPLLVSLLMVWFWRSKKSHTILFACFVFSHLYLFGTIANHFYVKSIFEESLAQQDISYEKLIVGPSLMNNILWYGVAIDGDTAWLGLFSHFDSDSNIALTPVDRRLDLRDDAPMESMENLQRFSRGFYLLRQYGDEVVMHDLRFGFIAPEKYLFSFSYDRPSGSPFMGYWHDDFSELFLPRVFGEEID
jgi:inner membrane protein